MTKVRLIAKRATLISLTVLQVLFYPALSYADVPAPSENSSMSTAEVVSPENAQNPEGTAPEQTTTEPESIPPEQEGTLEVTAAPETELEEQANAPAVNNSSTNTSSQDQDTTINSSVHVTNTIPTTAQSGDANIEGNLVAGDADSGDADGMVNLINMLQSQSNVIGQGNMLTFTADIQGDVVGDLLLDPGQLSVENNILSTANVRVTNAAGITNNVDLSAQSGDATIAENRVAGDATTGDADAVLNIVNILNSIVTAGGSFFGTINIHGNFNGDILLPPNFLSQALASNSIPTTSIDVPTEYILDTNLSNSQAINNNIDVTAASGDATVDGNRVAGDATTGRATTKVTVLNLTGNQVVAANTILVFVNVQGEWVGLLMDAPNGSTAAALSGGVVQNSVLSDTEIDVANNQQINNNANVHAQSGDATVRDNRVAGNATAGNATASANIANMANTQFSLSNWFGVLFINVFGTWHGSFGVNTAAGNPIATGGSGGDSAPAPTPQAIGFVPGGVSSTVRHFSAPTNSVSNATSTTPVAPSAETLSAATTENTAANPLQDRGSNGSGDSSSTSSWVFAGLGLLLAASILAGERFVTIIQRRRG